LLVARGVDRRDETIRELPRATWVPAGTDDEAALVQAFQGSDGVAHCAGINRELGRQTYRRVHIDGHSLADLRAQYPRLALRAHDACPAPLVVVWTKEARRQHSRRRELRLSR